MSKHFKVIAQAQGHTEIVFKNLYAVKSYFPLTRYPYGVQFRYISAEENVRFYSCTGSNCVCIIEKTYNRDEILTGHK